MKRSIAFVLTILAAAACTAAPPEPTVDVTAEIAALRGAAMAYQEAAIAADVDAITAFYAAESMAYPPNEAAVEGAEGFREFAVAFTSVPNMQVTFGDPQVVVAASGDLGYTFVEGNASFDGPDGETVEERLRDFHVWRKDASGSWKVVVDIWNSPDPLPGM